MLDKGREWSYGLGRNHLMNLLSANFAFTYAAGRYFFGLGGGLVEMRGSLR